MNKKHLILCGILLVAVMIVAALGANGSLFKGSIEGGFATSTTSSRTAVPLTDAITFASLQTVSKVALIPSDKTLLFWFKILTGNKKAVFKNGDYLVALMDVTNNSGSSLSKKNCYIMDNANVAMLTSSSNWMNDGVEWSADDDGISDFEHELNAMYFQFNQDVTIPANNVSGFQLRCDSSGLNGNSSMKVIFPKSVPTGMKAPYPLNSAPTTTVRYRLGTEETVTSVVNGLDLVGPLNGP